ncbi:NAD(P)/FAD-dependent oxidoreductase [Aliikangiella sp. IMCC44359]|uniref:NAD(P)/FAD-dependent oxidoreductase n=1 Tax=Aliikangiella sp. IMCC44359 TaxID=3459125 RepID=UPI00403A84ED
MQDLTYDVAIVGASMAGSCLARQLKLKRPELKIIVLDRKNEFDSWVGESTLETFWDYAANDLKLGYYLDCHHLYKHGLRFSFDTLDKNLKISEMSELSRKWFHFIPAHQLNRQKFDNDICRMNQEIGIDVRLGCTVKDILIDAEKGHKISTSKGTIDCRYLVDAAGFAAPLGKKMELIQSLDERHPVASHWGRFKNIKLIDHQGDEQWRERTNFTSRALATNHFMYKGYWIWLIPLDYETFSIGVTVKTDMVDITLKGEQEFIEFLQSHACMKELLGEQFELLDYKSMKKLSRQSKQSFSSERWFMTGMSSAFLEPMLSPGSAYLTDANRMIGDLIETDLTGDKETFEGKVKAYNAYLKLWFEGFFLHISGNYHGSYEVTKVHLEALLMHWYGLILPTSYARAYGYCPSMNHLSQEAHDEKMVNMVRESGISKINRIKNEFLEMIKGQENRKNQGEFYDIELSKDLMKHAKNRGATLDENAIMKLDHDMLSVMYRGFLRGLSDIENLGVSDEKLHHVVEMSIQDDLTLTQAFHYLRN